MTLHALEIHRKSEIRLNYLHYNTHDGPEVVGVLVGLQAVELHGCLLLLLVVTEADVGHEQG